MMRESWEFCYFISFHFIFLKMFFHAAEIRVRYHETAELFSTFVFAFPLALLFSLSALYLRLPPFASEYKNFAQLVSYRAMLFMCGLCLCCHCSHQQCHQKQPPVIHNSSDFICFVYHLFALIDITCDAAVSNADQNTIRLYATESTEANLFAIYQPGIWYAWQ